MQVDKFLDSIGCPYSYDEHGCLLIDRDKAAPFGDIIKSKYPNYSRNEKERIEVNLRLLEERFHGISRQFEQKN